MKRIKTNIENYKYVNVKYLKNTNLSDKEKSILGILCCKEYQRKIRQDWVEDYIFISYDEISEQTNIKAKKTISESITILRGLNIIKDMNSGGLGMCNQYFMCDDCLNPAMFGEEIIEQRSIPQIINNNQMEELINLVKEMKDRNELLLSKIDKLEKEIKELRSSLENDNSKELVIDIIPEKKEEEQPQVDFGKSFVFNQRDIVNLSIPELEEELHYREANNINPYVVSATLKWKTMQN